MFLDSRLALSLARAANWSKQWTKARAWPSDLVRTSVKQDFQGVTQIRQVFSAPDRPHSCLESLDDSSINTDQGSWVTHTWLTDTGHDAALLSDRSSQDDPRSWRLPHVAGLYESWQDSIPTAGGASRRKASRNCACPPRGAIHHENRLYLQYLQHQCLFLQPGPTPWHLRLLSAKWREWGGIHESQTESPRRTDPLSDPTELCLSFLFCDRRLGAHAPVLPSESIEDQQNVNRWTLTLSYSCQTVSLCSNFEVCYVVKICSETLFTY